MGEGTFAAGFAIGLGVVAEQKPTFSAGESACTRTCGHLATIRKRSQAGRAGSSRLKIAAGDAPAPPYFHWGWSRRATGSTTWKRMVRARGERRHWVSRSQTAHTQGACALGLPLDRPRPAAAGCAPRSSSSTALRLMSCSVTVPKRAVYASAKSVPTLVWGCIKQHLAGAAHFGVNQAEGSPTGLYSQGKRALAWIIHEHCGLTKLTAFG